MRTWLNRGRLRRPGGAQLKIDIKPNAVHLPPTRSCTEKRNHLSARTRLNQVVR